MLWRKLSPKKNDNPTTISWGVQGLLCDFLQYQQRVSTREIEPKDLLITLPPFSGTVSLATKAKA